MALPGSSPRLTLLDAVNMLLQAVGPSTIISVGDIEKSADAMGAYSQLIVTSREVQNRADGWNFNEEIKLVLNPDVNGEIYLPDNCLWVDLSEDYESRRIRKRGRRLYDADKHTYRFTAALTVDMAVLLDWDDLPEEAAYYIAIKARRQFTKDRPLSAQALRMDEEAESKALVRLEQHDASLGDRDAYTTSPHFRFMGRR